MSRFRIDTNRVQLRPGSKLSHKRIAIYREMYPRIRSIQESLVSFTEMPSGFILYPSFENENPEGFDPFNRGHLNARVPSNLTRKSGRIPNFDMPWHTRAIDTAAGRWDAASIDAWSHIFSEMKNWQKLSKCSF